MNANTARLIGFAIWRASKWYVRRRLPRRRVIALWTAAGAALLGAIFLARRAAG